MSASRVLIVEDDFLIRLMLAESLAEDGFEVIEAETADAAAERFARGERFDLLLTDVHVPGTLNGVDLVQRARQAHPDLPVIYVTGRPNAVNGLTFGKREVVIAKPYLPSEVCAAARRLVAGPAQPAPL